MSQPAIIFDLDGTLIDSAPAIHAVSNLELGVRGLPLLPLERVRGFVGRGVPHLVRCLLEASGQDPDGPLHAEVCESLLARYEHQLEGNTLYPRALDALHALKEAGHRLGLCTNKPLAPTRAVLEHLDIAPLFSSVIAGDSLATRKPNPEMLHQSIRQLGGTRAIYVGDSEVDAETAKTAGAPFALYTEGYRKTDVHALYHDVAFSNFAMLPGIVSRWHWHE
ncbi:phosphoglycolate phosphatase [Thioclava sp. A2]|uniref:phosphoglycolate phosphatase n=1 Tax=Thioclava sp. FCG-A2 TaxID=3080562 RepID=UPI002953AD52|nr:phosphoglycolate phosphatase [Thioclava sp. A2]MDV7269711.1 phosphoglycolate phosphatase [Thioclava sp. A2]